MKKPVLYVICVVLVGVLGAIVEKTWLTDQFEQRLAEKDAEQSVLGKQLLTTQNSLTAAQGKKESLEQRVVQLVETNTQLEAKNVLLADRLEEALPPKLIPNQIYEIGVSWQEGTKRYAFVRKLKNFRAEMGPLMNGPKADMEADGKWQRVIIDKSIRAGDDEPTTGLVYSVNDSTVRQYNVNEYLKQHNTATP